MKLTMIVMASVVGIDRGLEWRGPRTARLWHRRVAA